VSAIETIEVSQTSWVNGCSKFIFEALAWRPVVRAWFKRYDPPEATTIMTRMAKIQTRSWTWIRGSATARRMKEMSATPVTP